MQFGDLPCAFRFAGTFCRRFTESQQYSLSLRDYAIHSPEETSKDLALQAFNFPKRIASSLRKLRPSLIAMFQFSKGSVGFAMTLPVVHTR